MIGLVKHIVKNIVKLKNATQNYFKIKAHQSTSWEHVAQRLANGHVVNIPFEIPHYAQVISTPYLHHFPDYEHYLSLVNLTWDQLSILHRGISSRSAIVIDFMPYLTSKRTGQSGTANTAVIIPPQDTLEQSLIEKPMPAYRVLHLDDNSVSVLPRSIHP